VPYLVFLAPALLASAALMGGIEETTWPTFEGFVWGKQFRAIFASPVTGRQIALGVVWVSVLRTAVTTVLYWLVLLAFGAVGWHNALTLVGLCLVAGVAFSAMMLAVTVRVRNDDAFMSLFYRFALMPLFLFSGTFYPLDTLSIAVRWVGWLSPLWHATELGRWLSYGHAVPGAMLALHACYLIAMLTGGLWWGVRGYERRLTS
jgi:lipooligosaccharide transport system permease protein